MDQILIEDIILNYLGDLLHLNAYFDSFLVLILESFALNLDEQLLPILDEAKHFSVFESIEVFDPLLSQSYSLKVSSEQLHNIVDF